MKAAGNREGYAPPSPATQFMMSPQANFAYGYDQYHGFSPTREEPQATTPVKHTSDAPAGVARAGVPATVTTPAKADTANDAPPVEAGATTAL